MFALSRSRSGTVNWVHRIRERAPHSPLWRASIGWMLPDFSPARVVN